MTRIKFCGTCNETDLAESVAAGADAVGFVVEYPDPVPWNLERDRARDLVAQVPPFVSSVLVTTGGVDDVLERVDATAPDCLQLHGDESPATTAQIATSLTDSGVQTLKAVSIDAEATVDEQRERVRAFERCGLDGLVLDAAAEDRRGGGTGRQIPWDRARQLVDAASIPVVLAGGLTPSNVSEAVETVRPYGVDVISGVERERCSKSPERMARFTEAVAGSRR